MKRLRVLHNGNPLSLHEETVRTSPHWQLYVVEDGAVSGEILTKGRRWNLPPALKVSDPQRFYEIPDELKEPQLQANPDCEEIVVSLVEPSGARPCTFLMEQLPPSSSLRAGLEELVQKIRALGSTFSE